MRFEVISDPGTSVCNKNIQIIIMYYYYIITVLFYCLPIKENVT